MIPFGETTNRFFLVTETGDIVDGSYERELFDLPIYEALLAIRNKYRAIGLYGSEDGKYTVEVIHPRGIVAKRRNHFLSPKGKEFTRVRVMGWEGFGDRPSYPPGYFDALLGKTVSRESGVWKVGSNSTHVSIVVPENMVERAVEMGKRFLEKL